jgi:hypothetical protein|nr:hypothetical protein [Neorhizobium tomejilense]
MLSIFIMLFIAIGIAAGIGYAIVTLINTAQVSLTIQANQVRLQNISTAIRSGLTTDGGTVLLPISVDWDGDVPTNVLARLPSSTPFSTTTSGGEIVYCPAFPDPAPPSSPIMLNHHEDRDETFPVAVTKLGDKSYLTAGHASGLSSDTLDRLNEMGVIAYILSPQPSYKGPLLCGDVRVSPQDNYTLLVNGGSVVPVYTVTTDGRGSVFVLSEEGLPPGYNGSDRVVKSLKDVKDFIVQYQITDATVKLPEDYAVSLEDLDAFLQAGQARTLRLKPGGRDEGGNAVTHSTVTLTNPPSQFPDRNVYLKAKGTLVLEDITLDADGYDVAVDAGAAATVFLSDSQVAGLRTTGGRISTEGVTRIVPDDGYLTEIQPIISEGGEITLNSTASPAVNAPASVVMFSANAGTINLQPGLRIVANPTFPETRQLVGPRNGGRVVVSGGNPFLTVDRGAGYVDEGATAIDLSTRQTVAQACADGAVDCEVSCPSDKIVDFGFCSTSNGVAVTAFGPSVSLTSFSCSFGGGLEAPQQPRASAVCDFPK